MGKDTRRSGAARRRLDVNEEPAVKSGKKGLSTPVKVLLIILAVLFVAVAVLGVLLINHANSLMDNPEAAFIVDNDKDTDNKPQTIVSDDNKTYDKMQGIYNILLLGIDSNEAREKKNMGYRSDVMMLCSIDFDNNTMRLTSVPRDMWVEVPKKIDENGNVISTVSQRINTAYQYGGGPEKDGAKYAMVCMENFLSMDGTFDIDIDYFISIDIDGLYQLADDLGGVEVVLDRDVKGVGSKGETVTITSDNIDPYVRTRKGAGDDAGRVSRQQDYIMAVAKKIKEKGAIDSVKALYGTITEYAKTNLSLDQCLSVASFLMDFDLDNMTKYNVKGNGFTTSAGAMVAAVDEDALKEYLLENFYELRA